MEQKNIPQVNMGLIGVSRDCFPMELAKKRTSNVIAECKKLSLDITPCSVMIETEQDAMKAVAEMNTAGVNAALGFKPVGRILYDAMKVLGVEVDAPLPAGMLYPGESPFLN